MNIKKLEKVINDSQKEVFFNKKDYGIIKLQEENNSLILNFNYQNKVYTIQCKLKDDLDIQIIQNLLNILYKTQLNPLKSEIYSIKNKIQKQPERIYRWKSILHKYENDIIKKEECIQKLKLINEDIYIYYTEIEEIKENSLPYRILKNILYATLNYIKSNK